MLEVNPKLDRIEISVIRKVAAAAAKYKEADGGLKLINLTIGEPDLDQPKIIIEETKRYMDETKIKYAQLGGFQTLREEIAKKYTEQYGIECDADEVIVTVGTTEGISTTIKTIIQEGDEVILPTSIYPGYEPLIVLAGATPVHIDTIEDGCELTLEKLKKYVTPKTRAIIVNYPSNPTGAIISKKNRDEILKFAVDNHLYIISDEVYSDLVFNGEFNSFLTNEYRENVILLNGFSKSHSLTGWRVGFIISSKKLRVSLLKVHQYSVTSPSSISQKGALIALERCGDVSDRMEIYKKRANSLYNLFVENGFNPVKSEGGIYLFVSLREFKIDDSYDFALKLLDAKRVAVVPGVAFGAQGYIRISLIQDEKTLLEAGKRVIEYIKEAQLSK